MTTLNLACREGHTFEAWFRSQLEFSRQHADRLIACPWCGERDIERRPSVPNVLRSRDKTDKASLKVSEIPKTQAETYDEADYFPSPLMQSFAGALPAFHRYIERTCDDVGKRFAVEARKMHEEQEWQRREEFSRSKGAEKQNGRGIYGQASAEELHSLEEDGISVIPLPPLPNRYN